MYHIKVFLKSFSPLSNLLESASFFLKYQFFLPLIKIMTASLASFLGSLFFGTAIVILPITIALIFVSRIDSLSRSVE